MDENALPEGDTHKDRLSDYITNRMESIHDDQSILTEIDKEIKQITDGELNNESKRKNMKREL